jgi:hypothetical protein
MLKKTVSKKDTKPGVFYEEGRHVEKIFFRFRRLRQQAGQSYDRELQRQG